MKHVFVDTDMLIDFLADRYPFAENAAKLFECAARKTVKLYVASSSFNNIYYMVRQWYKHQRTIDLLKNLSEFVEILAVNREIIDKSLHSEFKDFEDAIQNFCAESNSKIEAIATRNGKDFKTSNLPVFDPMAILMMVNGR